MATILPINHEPERPDSGCEYRSKINPSLEVRVYRSSRSWVDYQILPAGKYDCAPLAEFMRRWEKK